VPPHAARFALFPAVLTQTGHPVRPPPPHSGPRSIYYGGWLPAAARAAAERLELLDELEEWRLMQVARGGGPCVAQRAGRGARGGGRDLGGPRPRSVPCRPPGPAAA
jgi:hypothetical protein